LSITFECRSSKGLQASNLSSHAKVYAGQNAPITMETLIAAPLYCTIFHPLRSGIAFLYNHRKKGYNQFNLFIWKHSQNYTKNRLQLLNKPCHEVRGFRKLYEELDDKVRLSGQSPSTLSNYAHNLPS
jgi:hypothetical protein